MLPANRPPTHSGEMLLKEFLEPIHMTQKAFSAHLGWTYAKLNEIIRRHRGVSIDAALSLAEAFEMEPEFWLNLQMNWDLWHTKKTHKKAKPLPFTQKAA